MTSQEMLKTKLPTEDHWFRNTAGLGKKTKWVIELKPEHLRKKGGAR